MRSAECGVQCAVRVRCVCGERVLWPLMRLRGALIYFLDGES
jgi:hypothetical protein